MGRNLALTTFILILAACTRAPEIDKSTLTDTAVEGAAYEYSIRASNEPTSFDAQIPAGLGLSVDKKEGKLSGTPLLVGEHSITITASNSAGSDSRLLALTVAAKPHPVVIQRELLIIHPAAVQDPELVGPGKPWHFRSVLQRIAGPNKNVDEFVAGWLEEWRKAQPIEKSSVPARPATAAVLQKAIAEDRVKLLAVVNRIDLTRFSGPADQRKVVQLGEGRLVYEVPDPRVPFTLILEFGLPNPSGDLDQDLSDWADRWHALGRESLGQDDVFPPSYRMELAKIVEDFSATGRLNQLRTDERVTNWDLREFKIDANSGSLKLAPLTQTPDQGRFPSLPELASWINANAEMIVDGRHVLPADLIAGGTDSARKWSIPPPTDANPAYARAHFIAAFNTCGDCHLSLTDTSFQHLRGFVAGQAAMRSQFMTGVVTLDDFLPHTESKEHDEMSDRAKLLLGFSRETSFSKIAPDEIDRILAARAQRVH